MPISNMLPWIILLSVVAFTAWWIFRPSARTRKTDFRVITTSTLLVLMSGGFVLWQSGFRPLSQEAIDGGDEEWDNESFLSCGFCPESCIDDMSSEICSRSHLLTKCLYCAWQACDFFCSTGQWSRSEACKICRSQARDLCNQIRCTSPESPGFNDSEPEPIGP